MPSGEDCTASSTTIIGAFGGNDALPAITTFGAIPDEVIIAFALEEFSCLEISSKHRINNNIHH